MGILDESTRIFRDAEFARQFLGFCLGLTFGSTLMEPPKSHQIRNRSIVNSVDIELMLCSCNRWTHKLFSSPCQRHWGYAEPMVLLMQAVIMNSTNHHLVILSFIPLPLKLTLSTTWKWIQLKYGNTFPFWGQFRVIFRGFHLLLISGNHLTSVCLELWSLSPMLSHNMGLPRSKARIEYGWGWLWERENSQVVLFNLLDMWLTHMLE